MKCLLKLALIAAFVLGSSGLVAREEVIMLSETRSISVAVPDGFNFKSGVNARGELAVSLVEAKEKLNLHVTFEPDPEGLFREARARKERLHEEFRSYVEGSVEKAMQFEELQTKVGTATYCVFTDDKLVGKTDFPPGEYLNLTVGVKAWPGIVATFTLFSNDTSSESYRALLNVLRESVHEKPAPML